MHGAFEFRFQESSMSRLIDSTSTSTSSLPSKALTLHCIALEMSEMNLSSSSSPAGIYGLPQCSIVPKARDIKVWSDHPHPSMFTKMSGSRVTNESLMKTRSKTEKAPRWFVHVGAPSSLQRPKPSSERWLKRLMDSGEELFFVGSQMPEGRLKLPCMIRASRRCGKRAMSDLTAEFRVLGGL